MKKEIKITFIVESEQQMKSNDEIKENLEEIMFDDFANEVDLRNFEISVKDI